MQRRRPARVVKKQNLYEDVMVRLADMIRQGKLRPGDRLPSERELADRMRVSRATLREALRALQLQGVVFSRIGAGTFISDGRSEDIARTLNRLALQDLFELRILIEPSIAALAAQRSTPLDISKLESILQKQERHLHRQKSTVEIDSAFHSTLAKATHNKGLMQISAMLMHLIAPSRNKSLQTPERAQRSLASHRRVFNMINAHSPEDARRAMEDHINSVDAALFGIPQSATFIVIPSLSNIPRRKEVSIDQTS